MTQLKVHLNQHPSKHLLNIIGLNKTLLDIYWQWTRFEIEINFVQVCLQVRFHWPMFRHVVDLLGTIL